MGDARTERAGTGGLVVEVHVEIVARDAAKVDQVGLADGAAVGQQRFTDLQILKVPAERVGVGFYQRCAAHKLAGDRCQHRRRALQGCALQVMFDSPQAAQLFATAGAAWAAVFELWQRRAVTGGFDRRLPVQDVQPAMPGGHLRDDLRGNSWAAGDQGGNQAALTARGQGDSLVHAVVRHQGADRAEGLDVVYRVGRQGTVADQQRRRKKRTLGRALTQRRKVEVAVINQLSALAQQRHPLGHVGLLGV